MESNQYMVDKLRNMKSKINTKCPESFDFYKNNFNRTKSRENKLRQFEIDYNNDILYNKKLSEIYLRPNNRKPAFEIKRNFMNASKKYEIIRMAQENQLMLKRINERGSYYSKDKWQKDYEQSQAYKRNHCIYPSIDFYNTQRAGNQNIFKNYKDINRKGYKTFSDFNYNDFKGVKNIENEKQKEEEKKEKKSFI
jgi:hypothetical protein